MAKVHGKKKVLLNTEPPERKKKSSSGEAFTCYGHTDEAAIEEPLFWIKIEKQLVLG